MTRTDRILALVSILVFAAFMAIFIWKVPDVALIVVSIVGVLMGGYDFARTAWRTRSR